jgi:hypothetical protein
MATTEELARALKNADAAGDTAAAQKLAQALAASRGGGSANAIQIPEYQPGKAWNQQPFEFRSMYEQKAEEELAGQFEKQAPFDLAGALYGRPSVNAARAPITADAVSKRAEEMARENNFKPGFGGGAALDENKVTGSTIMKAGNPGIMFGSQGVWEPKTFAQSGDELFDVSKPKMGMGEAVAKGAVDLSLAVPGVKSMTAAAGRALGDEEANAAELGQDWDAEAAKALKDRPMSFRGGQYGAAIIGSPLKSVYEGTANALPRLVAPSIRAASGPAAKLGGRVAAHSVAGATDWALLSAMTEPQNRAREEGGRSADVTMGDRLGEFGNQMNPMKNPINYAFGPANLAASRIGHAAVNTPRASIEASRAAGGPRIAIGQATPKAVQARQALEPKGIPSFGEMRDSYARSLREDGANPLVLKALENTPILKKFVTEGDNGVALPEGMSQDRFDAIKHVLKRGLDPDQIEQYVNLYNYSKAGSVEEALGLLSNSSKIDALNVALANIPGDAQAAWRDFFEVFKEGSPEVIQRYLRQATGIDANDYAGYVKGLREKRFSEPAPLYEAAAGKQIAPETWENQILPALLRYDGAPKTIREAAGETASLGKPGSAEAAQELYRFADELDAIRKQAAESGFAGGLLPSGSLSELSQSAGSQIATPRQLSSRALIELDKFLGGKAQTLGRTEPQLAGSVRNTQNEIRGTGRTTGLDPETGANLGRDVSQKYKVAEEATQFGYDSFKNGKTLRSLVDDFRLTNKEEIDSLAQASILMGWVRAAEDQIESSGNASQVITRLYGSANQRKKLLEMLPKAADDATPAEKSAITRQTKAMMGGKVAGSDAPLPSIFERQRNVMKAEKRMTGGSPTTPKGTSVLGESELSGLIDGVINTVLNPKRAVQEGARKAIHTVWKPTIMKEGVNRELGNILTTTGAKDIKKTLAEIRQVRDASKPSPKRAGNALAIGAGKPAKPKATTAPPDAGPKPGSGKLTPEEIAMLLGKDEPKGPVRGAGFTGGKAPKPPRDAQARAAAEVKRWDQGGSGSFGQKTAAERARGESNEVRLLEIRKRQIQHDARETKKAVVGWEISAQSRLEIQEINARLKELSQSKPKGPVRGAGFSGSKPPKIKSDIPLGTPPNVIDMQGLRQKKFAERVMNAISPEGMAAGRAARQAKKTAQLKSAKEKGYFQISVGERLKDKDGKMWSVDDYYFDGTVPNPDYNFGYILKANGETYRVPAFVLDQGGKGYGLQLLRGPGGDMPTRDAFKPRPRTNPPENAGVLSPEGQKEWDELFREYDSPKGPVRGAGFTLPEKSGRPIGFHDELPRGTKRFHSDKLTASQNKSVEMARNGYSNAEIAEEMEITANAVSVHLRNARLRGVDYPASKTGKQPTTRTDILRAAESGAKATAIAERLGISPVQVRVTLSRARKAVKDAGRELPEWLKPQTAGLDVGSEFSQFGVGTGLGAQGAQDLDGDGKISFAERATGAAAGYGVIKGGPRAIAAARNSGGRVARGVSSASVGDAGVRSVRRPVIEGMTGVEGNVHGLSQHLRVNAGKRIANRVAGQKPMFTQVTNNKNAPAQIENLDILANAHPDAGASTKAWNAMMADALGTADVPAPPYAFIRDINGDGASKLLKSMNKGQIADANAGISASKEMRRMYTSGEMSVDDTGKIFLWSFLSRGVSPYTQESLFLDSILGIDKWIKHAADGTLKKNMPAFNKWAAGIAPKGSGVPGAGAKHNLNGYGKNFLIKMSEPAYPGANYSRLQHLHNMISDPNMTGKQIRREFLRMSEGVGIDNKVVSFSLLVSGFDDIMVLDRVQVRQMWNDGRFDGMNLYDGFKEGKNVVTGSALSNLTYGARGLAVYESAEAALAKNLKRIYAEAGRPGEESVGRYHWDTWVASSNQEAGHSTIDIVRKNVLGDKDAIYSARAKNGEYGEYTYGAMYGKARDGTDNFQYDTGNGTYQFKVDDFGRFIAEVKKPKNGVVPQKFKVSEAGNEPWYNKEGVNREKIKALAEKYGQPIRVPEGYGPVRGAEATVRRGTNRPGEAGGQTVQKGPIVGAGFIGGKPPKPPKKRLGRGLDDLVNDKPPVRGNPPKKPQAGSALAPKPRSVANWSDAERKAFINSGHEEGLIPIEPPSSFQTIKDARKSMKKLGVDTKAGTKNDYEGGFPVMASLLTAGGVTAGTLGILASYLNQKPKSNVPPALAKERASLADKAATAYQKDPNGDEFRNTMIKLQQVDRKIEETEGGKSSSEPRAPSYKPRRLPPRNEQGQFQKQPDQLRIGAGR